MISEPYIILEPGHLEETERFVGCFAVLDEMLGLSFKGLRTPIDIRIGSQPYRCQPGTFQPLAVNPSVRHRIHSLIYLWWILNRLIQAESDPDAHPIDLQGLRGELNEAYDDFVRQFGFINDNKHLLRFDGVQDPRLFVLTELEVGPDFQKAEIFSDRVLHPQQLISGQMFFQEDLSARLSQALNKCLSEQNKINVSRIAELAGVDEETAVTVLLESGRIYRDPISKEGSYSRSFGSRI